MRKNNLGNQLIFTDEASAKTVVTKFKQYILSKGETITNESFPNNDPASDIHDDHESI